MKRATYILLDLAEQTQLPGCGDQWSGFLNAEQFDAHEIRVAIHDGYTLEDPRRPKITALSNIYAPSKRCVSCLRIFRKR